MKTWNGGGGFSVNGTARIHENDREGLRRLLRYCTRPPFALERIKQQPDGSLIYQLNKPLPNSQTQLKLTSLELIDKLAVLVPPPRIHRHRYYGVLASNSPFRASVTAMAGLSLAHGSIEVQSSDHKEKETIEQEQENKPKHPPNRYLWAMLLARIYNLFPLLCLECVTEMQVIAVIQDKPVINKTINVFSGEQLNNLHFLAILQYSKFASRVFIVSALGIFYKNNLFQSFDSIFLNILSTS